MEHVSLDGRLTGSSMLRPAPVLAAEDSVPVASAVLNLLLQALESSDQSLLDWCLERTATEAIPSSIISLSPTRAQQLLYELSNRFLMFHQSAGVVLAWLKPLLLIHKHNLPAESLQDMTQKLKIRVGKFKQVSELKAKMEFLTAPNAGKTGFKVVTNRAVTYSEDDTDETMDQSEL